MAYTPTYTKPYPDGWKNLPEETTPITAEVLDAIDSAIAAIEAQLKTTTGLYSESFYNNLNSELSTIRAIAEGASNAKIFDTKAALDEWLAAEGNQDTLKTGQNIYIRAADTPDYWWDGTALQILETQKVNLEGYVTDGELETALNGYLSSTDTETSNIDFSAYFAS